ncbi:MAG TPA: hypothetical protein VGC41_17815 [Kofleriaceae bacterium]
MATSDAVALERIGDDRARLVRGEKSIVTVHAPGHGINLVALAVGPAIIVADTSGQAFKADASGVVPLEKLVAGPITALAASPTRPLVAIGDGRDVVIYDLEHHRELARGNTDSTVTALAWSSDGTQLAAAAATTQISVWSIKK